MKKLILTMAFLIMGTCCYSQSIPIPIKRFWYGLFGPVYHSDKELKVFMFNKGDTLTTLLPKNIDYYIIYENNDQFFIKILNPIYLDIRNDSTLNIFVKDYLDNEKSKCRLNATKEYKKIKKELESGKKPSYSNDSTIKTSKGIPKMNISKREYVELTCKSYDTVTYERQKTLFYVNDPKPYEKVFRQGITTGSLFLPIKIRPSIKVDGTTYQRDFSTDISVGPYIGYKYQIGQRYDQFVSAGVFAGPSLIRINSNNSNNPNEEESNILGFTWGLGLTFEINKFQIGVVGGFDYLSDHYAKDWIYDKKFWVSIGIGFQFFQQK